MGRSDFVCLCLLAALLREVFTFFSPVPQLFPLASVSCTWTHHFCPDSDFSLAQEMLNETSKSQSCHQMKDDPSGHKVSIRYLGRGDCAAANTSVQAPELERQETL